MNLFVLCLVLGSCITHASWNLIAKRSAPSLKFFWGSSLAIAVISSPAFVIWAIPVIQRIQFTIWECLIATGIAQVAYYYCLSTAYQSGDISVVYPLSRSSLLFIVPLAGLLEAQWPTRPAYVGIAMAVGGGLILPRKSFRFRFEGAWKRFSSGGGGWAILTAFTSSLYTMIDAVGMRTVRSVVPGIHGALLYGYLEYAFVALFLTPIVFRNRGKASVRSFQSQQLPRSCVVVGVLDFVTYLLVLWAYSLTTHIAYVAAMRQFSTVLGVIGGLILFKEPGGVVRIAGTLIMMCGLVLIALTR